MNIPMNIIARPTVSINIERRRKTTSGVNKGKYHIKLWVTFKVWENDKWKWKQRPYKTGKFATLEEFDKGISGKLKRDLITIEYVANKLIDDHHITDQSAFEMRYLSGVNPESVEGQYLIKIRELESQDKFSSAEKYSVSLKSFQEFFHPNVSFQEITKSKLDAYEDWYTTGQYDDKGNLISPGQSIVTVGINCRCLRHIFRRAIRKNIIPEALYPFGADGGYIIPEGNTEVKQFLEDDEKRKFMDHRFEDPGMTYLHDLCKFSYYESGMNFADVLRLKRKEVNFQQGYISRVREKVKGRRKKAKRMTLVLHPVADQIIRKYMDATNIDPNSLIFPTLKDCKTAKEMFLTIRNTVKRTNAVLEKIAKQYQFPVIPTTYTLRHTFSATMLRMGASTEQLQDELGHGDIKTTEVYKHGFSLGIKKKFSEGL